MLFLIVFCSFFQIYSCYEVPDAIVEAYTPRGFKVSIPDEEGVKVFAFHGKINEEFVEREAGTFSRDINKAKDGYWTFYDPNTSLKVGDILYFWTYVLHSDGLGYPKDGQMFQVKELISQPAASAAPTTSSTAAPTTSTTAAPVQSTTTETAQIHTSTGSCDRSATTYNNGLKVCKEKLLLNESFKKEPKTKTWTVEQKFASSPDYEFVIYVNQPETIHVINNTLRIKPELLEDVYGEGFVTQSFDLGENCTGIVGSPECKIKPDGGFILPPVLSSRINSKGKFSFKYGKVEIRAKLPRGDWIYPELYLNSAKDDYGSDYDSGQIRIAFTQGNADSNKILHGGVILGTSPSARAYGIKTIEKRTSWTSEYHKFGLKWKPDSITLSVDDKVYGTIYPPTGGFRSLSTNLQIKNADRWRTGSALAPFDKEMYLTLGVGVAGFNFEDRSDGSKPWKNGGRSSMKNFYEAQSEWSKTWNEKSALVVDYVKVWAL